MRYISDKGDISPLMPVAQQETSPWTKIAIDLVGPSHTLNDSVYLSIIDLYSRYPEVYRLRQATSVAIISCLKDLFSRFGLPRVLVSDNGTPFVSAAFEHYLEECGIQHVRSSNYYPQSNGTIERFHSTFKSRIKRLRIDNWPLEEAITQVMGDIRSSPHEMTGETPFHRLFGRQMRTKLSLLQVGTSPEKGPAVPARDATAEYIRKSRKAVHRTYKVGDTVAFRTGMKQPFTGRGTILKRLSNRTYEVQIHAGQGERIAKYNKFHLKPINDTLSADSELDEQEAAYDAVLDDVPPPVKQAQPRSILKEASSPVGVAHQKPRRLITQPKRYMFE